MYQYNQIIDALLCNKDTFTFFSEAHDSVAWLDHVVSTQHFHSLIKRIWVDNSTVTSDHFPVFTELCVFVCLFLSNAHIGHQPIIQFRNKKYSIACSYLHTDTVSLST